MTKIQNSEMNCICLEFQRVVKFYNIHNEQKYDFFSSLNLKPSHYILRTKKKKNKKMCGLIHIPKRINISWQNICRLLEIK